MAENLATSKQWRYYMKHELEPAPFQRGDRLQYIGGNLIEAPSPFGGEHADRLLEPGMVGTVMKSQPGWIDPVSGKPQPAHCRIKFDTSGYEFTINANNKDRFKELRKKGEGAAPVADDKPGWARSER